MTSIIKTRVTTYDSSTDHITVLRNLAKTRTSADLARMFNVPPTTMSSYCIRHGFIACKSTERHAENWVMPKVLANRGQHERPSNGVTQSCDEVCLLLPEIRKILLVRLKTTQSEQSKCRYKISES